MLLFADVPVGTMDDVVAGVVVPIISLSDSIPLIFEAIEVDIGQSATALER